jgi:hypothetical protein
MLIFSLRLNFENKVSPVACNRGTRLANQTGSMAFGLEQIKNK